MAKRFKVLKDLQRITKNVPEPLRTSFLKAAWASLKRR